MEPIDFVIKSDDDWRKIEDILSTSIDITSNWAALFVELDVPDTAIDELRRKTSVDTIRQCLYAWHCNTSYLKTTLTTIITAVEKTMGQQGSKAGAKLRENFNLPCKGFDHSNQTWEDLGQLQSGPIFQAKIRETLDRDYPKLVLDVSNLSQPVLAALMTQTVPPLYNPPIPVLPYYVERSFVPKNVLSSGKIFTLDIPDIFIFTGLKFEELLEKAAHECIAETNSQLSRQDTTISDAVKFMVQDNEGDFEEICERTEKSVHLVHCKNDTFTLIKSNGPNLKGKMDKVRNCIDELTEHVDDDALITWEWDSMPPPTTIIVGSLGMGKSTTLVSIANKLKKIETPTTQHLTLVTVAEFVQKLKEMDWDKNDPLAISQVLENLICYDELGKAVLRQGLKSGKVKIELFLDDFDNVSEDECALAVALLSTIQSKFTYIRLWITTKPDKTLELENGLGVLAYNLVPFDRKKELDFLVHYWGVYQKQDEKISPELDSEKLQKLGNECLTRLESTLQSDNFDIAGAPLACALIAEAFQPDAKGNIKTKFRGITSISSLYKRFIISKMESYLSADDNTEKNRLEIMLMHAAFAMQQLFPQYKALTDISIHAKESFQPQPKLLMEYDLVEEYQNQYRFIHKSFAEYFIAWLAVETLKPTGRLNIKVNACGLYPPTSRLSLTNEQLKAIIKFIFECVLMTSNDNDGETDDQPQFKYHGICFFLNSQISEEKVKLGNADRFKEIFADLPMMKAIANACVRNNFFCVFKALHEAKAFKEHAKSIFDPKFLLATVTYSTGSEFIEVIYPSPYFSKHYKFDQSLQNEVLRKLVKRGEYSILAFLRPKISKMLQNKTTNDNNTILHDCIENSKDDDDPTIEGKLNVIALLVNINGKLVSVKNNDGLTPLFCPGSHPKLVKQLIKVGSKEKPPLSLSRTPKNDTVIHFDPARCNMSREDYQLLLQCINIKQLKELVKVVGEMNDTPLMRIRKYMDPLPDTLDLFRIAEADFGNCLS